MSKTFEQGKDEVVTLCRYFATNAQAFVAAGVKEAHVRQMLIDPFFEALGWDMRNAAMHAPQYREVVTEDSLDVEGQQKAPDYTFRVGKTPRFYVEAKKCGVNIQADPAPAYQLRRYGWSAKVAVSILTDFEELGVYDCTSRPQSSDKASRARIQFFRFGEFPDRWRELWDVFSREAVWSGAFDQFAASKRKRGTSEVDIEFLKEIESWRESLARNMALRNKDLSSDDLNAAVQRTIDRVVFLRMAEDRALEPDYQLLKLCERPDIYARFMRDLCRKADEKYNSGLFHFQNEPDVSETPDRITPHLAIDDKVFKPILENLYFEHGSPYHFGVLPVEILGTVYERFLGKVIRLTAGHQAKVEEKPEVRKAGGVYYTPSFVVNYVVANAIGKQINDKSPAELAGGKGKPTFRVLDMACGSGSFLLGAYQYLLDYCLKWYVEHNPEANKKAVYRDPRSGEWRLTIEERKRILTTHVFGVDIDQQAVEVTKLSLLLKALEGETDATLSMQSRLFHERALPNLSDNIKCGNSLIGPAYFSGKLPLDPDELKRINPFDWKAEFPEAMKSGGFDCIVGNPPYIRIQTMKEWASTEVEIYKELYKSARQGNYDIYVVFLERALQLLNPTGRLGFICPHKFFNANYGTPIRSIVAEGCHLSHVVHFGAEQIFDGATTYTCLIFLDKSKANECCITKVNDVTAWRANGAGAVGLVSAEQITASEWNFSIGTGVSLLAKLNAIPTKLNHVTDRIFQGLKTGGDKVFIVRCLSDDGNRLRIYSQQTGAEHLIEKSLLHPLIKGGDSKAYSLASTDRLILFPYSSSNGTVALITARVLKDSYPCAWEYLTVNRDFLQDRESGKMKGENWYAYTRNQAMDVISTPKIFTPDISTKAAFSLDDNGSVFFTGGVAGGYGIVVSPHYSREYILGILNSRLLDWIHHESTTQMRGGWFSYESRFIRNLPIRTLDLGNPSERTAHSRMVVLVNSMLSLNRDLVVAKSASHAAVIQRQLDAARTEIDQLVYGLYELSEDEVAIVEGMNE